MSATYGSGRAGTDEADPEAVAILHALAGVPEAQGMGVIVIRNGSVYPLRRPTPPASQWLVVGFRPAAAAPPLPQQPHEHVGGEWADFGMNCGGLVLTGAGTVGTVFLAPETGGASFGGTVYMASQAAVALGQCSVSVYRLWNVYHGRQAVNDALDNSRWYHVVMYTADAYALVDVARTGVETMRYARDVEEAEVSFSRLLSEQLNRNERLRLTEALELQGARRVAAARLAMHARTQITQAIAAVMALGGSARSGLLHAIGERLYVWAIDSSATEQEANPGDSAAVRPPGAAIPPPVRP